MAQFNSLKDFGTSYFDSKGGKNPVRERDLRVRTKEITREIKDGKHDHLLNICGITSQRGKYGRTIKPVELRLSNDGGFDTLRMNIHLSVKVGDRTTSGRTILGINRDGWKAKMAFGRKGNKIVPYIRIFKAAK